MTFDERIYLLWLYSINGVGNATLNRVMLKNAELNLRLSDTFEMTPMDLFSTYRLSPKMVSVIESYKDRIKETEVLYKRLFSMGVEIITHGDNDYPLKLKDSLSINAPSALFIKGNKRLLQMDSIAIVGSRNCTETALHIAKEFASVLSTRANIISGYAKGVDTEAHKGALSAGGYTTIFLSCGILGFRLKQELKALWDNDRTLVISEFQPELPWSRGLAMTRNKTICGLSDAIIVVEAGTTGGAIDAGIAALKQDKILYVSDHMVNRSGNSILIEKGGIPVNLDTINDINLHKRKTIEQTTIAF